MSWIEFTELIGVDPHCMHSIRLAEDGICCEIPTEQGVILLVQQSKALDAAVAAMGDGTFMATINPQILADAVEYPLSVIEVLQQTERGLDAIIELVTQHIPGGLRRVTQEYVDHNGLCSLLGGSEDEEVVINGVAYFYFKLWE